MKVNITLINPDKETRKFIINIRCDDECKNGNDTWAITAYCYDVGQRGQDCSSCGCLHEEIFKYRPDLKPFIDLHLSDGDGVPMYALENGYYHLQGYMGTASYNHTMKRKDVASYLRVTEVEIQKLADIKATKIQFAEFIKSKESQWKIESNNAKILLKSLI